ncbi:unnamed protein product, partial [Iphiclides podalirius]
VGQPVRQVPQLKVTLPHPDLLLEANSGNQGTGTSGNSPQQGTPSNQSPTAPTGPGSQPSNGNSGNQGTGTSGNSPQQGTPSNQSPTAPTGPGSQPSNGNSGNQGTGTSGNSPQQGTPSNQSPTAPTGPGSQPSNGNSGNQGTGTSGNSPQQGTPSNQSPTAPTGPGSQPSNGNSGNQGTGTSGNSPQQGTPSNQSPTAPTGPGSQPSNGNSGNQGTGTSGNSPQQGTPSNQSPTAPTGPGSQPSNGGGNQFVRCLSSKLRFLIRTYYWRQQRQPGHWYIRQLSTTRNAFEPKPYCSNRPRWANQFVRCLSSKLRFLIRTYYWRQQRQPGHWYIRQLSTTRNAFEPKPYCSNRPRWANQFVRCLSSKLRFLIRTYYWRQQRQPGHWYIRQLSTTRNAFEPKPYCSNRPRWANQFVRCLSSKLRFLIRTYYWRQQRQPGHWYIRQLSTTRNAFEPKPYCSNRPRWANQFVRCLSSKLRFLIRTYYWRQQRQPGHWYIRQLSTTRNAFEPKPYCSNRPRWANQFVRCLSSKLRFLIRTYYWRQQRQPGHWYIRQLSTTRNAFEPKPYCSNRPRWANQFVRCLSSKLRFLIRTYYWRYRSANRQRLSIGYRFELKRQLTTSRRLSTSRKRSNHIAGKNFPIRKGK